MASIHLQSLYIGRFYKVAPNPDYNPDQDHFFKLCVKGHILLFLVVKCTQLSGTTDTIAINIFFQSNPMLNKIHFCDPEE